MARKGRFTQASISQKTMIYHNTHFGTFKALITSSYNTAGDRTLTSHDNELYTPVVVEVVGLPKTDEQSLKQPPGPPFEVFTTTVSNILWWLVAETLIEDGILSSVGV